MAQLTKTVELNGKTYMLTDAAAKALEEVVAPFAATAVDIKKEVLVGKPVPIIKPETPAPVVKLSQPNKKKGKWVGKG